MTQIGCCGFPQQPKFYASWIYSLVGSGSPSPCAMDSLYEFLIKRLKAFYSAAGLRPAATAAKNEDNTFLTAAQAVCRETAE